MFGENNYPIYCTNLLNERENPKSARYDTFSEH